MQDLNNNQSKLEVQDAYEKDEKITTNFKAVNEDYVINKAYKDKKLTKKCSYFIYRRDYNGLKILSGKKSLEEVLIQENEKFRDGYGCALLLKTYLNSINNEMDIV